MRPPLILGAGPAGCAAAIALGRAGVSPQLLDRHAEPGDALCGGFLSWRTAEHLQALGVEPRTLGAHAVDRLALFAGSQTAEIALPASAWGLSRHALDTALRRAALEAGARFQVFNARNTHGEWLAGDSVYIGMNTLFLASGKHDVRGLARPRTDRDPAVGLRLRLPATAERSRLLGGRIELHLFAKAYAGIVLQEGGSANVCLAMRKSRLAALGGEPAAALERLADANPRFAERLGDDWRAARIDSIGAVPYGYLARHAEPGVFRLGDQAAVIPSLAGEGIAIALASGELAARHWLDGGRDAAEAYQRELTHHVAEPVRLAGLAWKLLENALAARGSVKLAALAPPLVQALMAGTRIPLAGSLARGGAAP